jgi:quinol monooxygenase YgiN
VSVLVILEVKAKPNSREYDGCQNITTHLSDDGVSVVLVEHWDSKEHYDKYLAWREETGVMDVLGAMLEGQPSIRFFTTIDV